MGGHEYAEIAYVCRIQWVSFFQWCLHLHEDVVEQAHRLSFFRLDTEAKNDLIRRARFEVVLCGHMLEGFLKSLRTCERNPEIFLLESRERGQCVRPEVLVCGLQPFDWADEQVGGGSVAIFGEPLCDCIHVINFGLLRAQELARCGEYVDNLASQSTLGFESEDHDAPLFVLAISTIKYSFVK